MRVYTPKSNKNISIPTINFEAHGNSLNLIEMIFLLP